MIDGTPLHKAMTNLLAYLPTYAQPSLIDKTNAEASLNVCRLVRAVTSHYACYQLSYGRDGLRPDLKRLTEKTVLCTLKKLEWVAKRQQQTSDDYFKAYYSTLRRYLEVNGGWLLIKGTWTQVPVSKNKL